MRSRKLETEVARGQLAGARPRNHPPLRGRHTRSGLLPANRARGRPGGGAAPRRARRRPCAPVLLGLGRHDRADPRHARTGDTVAIADGGYYGTYAVMQTELTRWGLNVEPFDQTGEPPNADLVWLEPCSNPMLTFPDLDVGDRLRARLGSDRRRRQHGAEPGPAAPARARRGLRAAQRDEGPGRSPRRAARRGGVRPSRRSRAPAPVPDRDRDRGRAGPRLADAAGDEDTGAAGPTPIRHRTRAGSPPHPAPGRASACGTRA